MEYHKIETLYERGDNFKVKPGALKSRAYGVIKTWHWTEKIDGTNIRIIWEDGKMRFNGRSDNAQMPGDLVKTLYESVDPVKLADIFQGTKAVVYGEGYGAGIQKCGVLYGPKKKFIGFDVLVEDKWWLSREDVEDVLTKLGLDAVPYLGEMTLEEATEKVRVGFPSAINSALQAEGMVGRPIETLFDKKGARLIVKLKTKDF
jgi:hypothetical protein